MFLPFPVVHATICLLVANHGSSADGHHIMSAATCPCKPCTRTLTTSTSTPPQPHAEIPDHDAEPCSPFSDGAACSQQVQQPPATELPGCDESVADVTMPPGGERTAR